MQLHILPIQHIWQLDNAHQIPNAEKTRICGLACMQMVCAYLCALEQKESASLESIYSEFTSPASRDAAGDIRHSEQVEWFKSKGLVAWRRNWLAPTQNPKWLVENEGYNNAQLKAISAQLKKEVVRRVSLREQMLETLVSSLAQGMPVIVSVKPGFSHNTQNHQVVLVGYTTEDPQHSTPATVSVVDPLTPEPLSTRPVEEFMRYFNRRAIFVTK